MGIYLFDSHVHSVNSPDGCDKIEDLCEAALKRGLRGICITDHCEAHEYVKDDYERRITDSHEQVMQAQEKYKGKFNLRKGIELGEPLQAIETTEEILKKFPCDFIIGSVHNAKGQKDFHCMTSKEEFLTNIDALLESYYEEYLEMTKWGKFDVIGHITYPLRYIEGIFKCKVDFSKYNEIIDEMLKETVRKGIGIEINVSGFRQPYGKQFPNIEHIKQYKEYGGEIITIGTDAHQADTVGVPMEKAVDILKTLGYKYYTYFENRKPIMIKL